MTTLASIDPVSGGQAVAVVAAAAMLMLVPGYGAVRLFARGSDWLFGLAAGPAVTAGLLYVVGEVMTLAGVSVNWLLGLVAVAAGGVAVVLARRTTPNAAVSRERLLALGLTAAFILGAVIWLAGIGHLGAVPPHNDGLNHGFFTARIDLTGSLAPSDVLVSDVVRGGSGVEFYPLALHQQAAMVMQATGADAGFAFTVVSLLYAGVGLSAGMALLTRRLFSGMPTAPAIAAVLSAAVPALPYSTSWWGGYAMAAGLAVVPAAVLLVLGCGERRSIGWGVVAALAVAGTAGIHTSELPLIPIVVGFLLFARTRETTPAPRWWIRTLWSAGSMVAAVVLLAPALSQMAGGYDERQYPVPDQILPFGRALTKVALLLQFVDPPTPAALVLVFWVGIVATFVARRARAWSALWITFGVLFVWLAAAPSSLNVQLTAVWYSDPFRLAYILAFLAIPIAAFTFAGLVETGLAVVRREPHPAATAAPSGSASPFALLPRLALPAAAVLGLALVVPAVVTSIQTIRTNYRDYSLVSADSRRAFAFLQAHVGRGEHVLNQRQDGSPWMYPLAGVAPLVALKTVDWDGPAWADRLYAADHADELATNSRVQAIFNDYDIHYVYVAPRIFDTDKRLLDGDDLAASGAFREVFRSGGVRVFEVSG